MTRRKLTIPTLALCAALLPGCLSLSLRTEQHDPALAVSGIVDGYVTPDALGSYDGELLHAGLFGSSARKGEIASLDVWPLFGVGIGVVGARVRVLPIEAALGTLFYEPSRPRHAAADDDVDDDSDDGANDDAVGSAAR